MSPPPKAESDTAMIVVMKSSASARETGAVLQQIESLGFKPHISSGEERTVIGIIGSDRKVEPAAFYARTQEFIKQYQIGDDRGMPIVAPPPGSDIYLTAMSFQWTPILQLEQGKEYILHLSSLDVNHGFSLYPINVNFQVVPGYDYGLRVTPTAAGDFRIICNEFCGIGHHTMVGRVIVVDSTGTVPSQSGGI